MEGRARTGGEVLAEIISDLRESGESHKDVPSHEFFQLLLGRATKLGWREEFLMVCPGLKRLKELLRELKVECRTKQVGDRWEVDRFWSI